jgi:hypothetical protein
MARRKNDRAYLGMQVRNRGGGGGGGGARGGGDGAAGGVDVIDLEDLDVFPKLSNTAPVVPNTAGKGVPNRPTSANQRDSLASIDKTAAELKASRAAQAASDKLAKAREADKANADATHYRRYTFQRSRNINDAVAFMPEIIGAFEQASNGPADCYLTTPISNFRLPEINYNEAQWNRRTWRETNKVRNALSRLHVDPYDSYYKLNGAGAKDLAPLISVLTVAAAIEKDMIDCLVRNAGNITENAANLRWMVVDTIRSVYGGMRTKKARSDARHQIKKMIKTVFSDRYRMYEKLPFMNKSHQNNEVWNGIDYASAFHRAIVLPDGVALLRNAAGSGVLTDADGLETTVTGEKAVRDAYVACAKLQEQSNIDIAVTSMRQIGNLYKNLSDSLPAKSGAASAIPIVVGAVDKHSDFLTAVDAAFKAFSLERAGLTGTPNTESLATGALMLDLKKATGTFVWELLLERLEILRSNVFSFFSIVTHDTVNSESKSESRAKGVFMNSATALTDAFMEKAIPSCFCSLFEKMSPAIETDLMNIDQKKLDEFIEIKGYFESLRLGFKPSCTKFFKDITVSPFSVFHDYSNTTENDEREYVALVHDIEHAMVDEGLTKILKYNPTLRCLKIKSIFTALTTQFDLAFACLESNKIDRHFVSGTAAHHPLKQYANRARDEISRTLKGRLDITDLDTDYVYGAVCKILHTNYFMDGAFVALMTNPLEHAALLDKARFVRRYYRSMNNPISVALVSGTTAKFSDDVLAPVVATPSSREDSGAFATAYTGLIAKHPILKYPDWVKSADMTFELFKTELTPYTGLFNLKPGAAAGLTRSSPPKAATAQSVQKPAHSPGVHKPVQQHQPQKSQPRTLKPPPPKYI